MKARYFLKFSYIGTYFRGAEKLWIRTTKNEADPETVQGVMEIALRKLRTIERPQVNISSRTDAGVHAIVNTAHVNLDAVGRVPFQEDLISKTLNSYFNKNKLSILVNDVRRVPDNFSARHHARSRTYVYRFATLKKNIELAETQVNLSLYPVEEWRRCLFIRHPDFDIEKFKAGAEYLPGLHDWSSFKKAKNNQPVPKHNRRTLLHALVRPGQSVVPLQLRRKRPDYFDYWEAEFKGIGFVHNQIRRMMGALKAAAIDRIPVEEIKVMLQVPSKLTWPPRADCVPAHGLYLTDVEYDASDLEYHPSILEHSPPRSGERESESDDE